MAYYIDAEKVSLDDLRKRIEDTDLIPSRVSLLENIAEKMKRLEQQGITTFAQLRTELKNSKRLEALAKVTGIDVDYLVLLRREIESFFPRSFPLRDFDWLPDEEISKLKKVGVGDIASFYQKACNIEKRKELAKTSGVDIVIIETLTRLADLTRVQWVSPTTARMLVEAGYDNAAKLAAADGEELFNAFVRVNDGGRFFKGTIGLRDVKRLIRAASYI